ncbi:hypothetical protein [Algoriphagus formosus]|uniref:hypothetical protein n=1 Tax=Algoriphagus formosus TaxID=2007308 RepID=UPI0012FD5497|nr:hypothetical protein [Algoriphagus formosus]
MDIEGLRILLNEQTYSDVPKDLFLERLEEHFEDFKNPDKSQDSGLIVLPGICCHQSCEPHLGRAGYKFIGFSGIHFDLRFATEMDEGGIETVKDIFACNRFVTFKKEEGLGDYHHFWVYEDDQESFQKTPEYILLVEKAKQGVAFWKEEYEEEVVSLSDLRGWLNHYQPVYFNIQENLEMAYFLDNMPNPKIRYIKRRWDDFLNLYSFLDLLIHLIKDFQHDFQRFQLIVSEPILEESLMDWVLEIEEKIERNQYWRLQGMMTSIEFFPTEWKLCRPLGLSFEIEDNLIAVAEEFLTWFEIERKKLVLHYFSLTQSELDEFMDQNTDPDLEYRVKRLLSFHLDNRERFRKEGVYIPYNLGVSLRDPFGND